MWGGGVIVMFVFEEWRIPTFHSYLSCSQCKPKVDTQTQRSV